MSKIGQHIIKQQEQSPELAEKWWIKQDSDNEFERHCEKLISEPDTKEGLEEAIDWDNIPF